MQAMLPVGRFFDSELGFVEVLFEIQEPERVEMR